MNRFYQKEVESNTEYVLPDYLGDVKKVLSVTAAATPSGRFVSDGNIEFSGIVAYDVLYADADGELTNLSLTSDYDFSVPADEKIYADSIAAPKVSNVSVRFTGPRKLVAKASVSNSIVLSLESDAEVMGNAFEGDNVPEVDTKKIKEENLLFASSAEREYAEEAERLAAISADEIVIIASSGAVRVTESMPTENGVTVKGEIVITSIIRTEEQPPFAISKTIPFEETISLDGLTPDMQTSANGYLTSVSTGLAEDSDGVSVTVNAIAEFVCFASQNKEVSVIADAYLKERDTEVKYENYTYSELVCMGNFSDEFVISAARDDIGCEDVREIINMNCDLRHVEKKIKPQGFELSGEAAVSGIACQINDENQPIYIPIKFTSPFAVNVNSDCHIPDNAVIECKPLAQVTKTTLETEHLAVKCAVSSIYHARVEPCVKKVCECNTVGDGEYAKSSSTVTVYYPDDGEVLFDIAKRYHTTCAKIAEDSGLSVETFSFDSGVLKGSVKLIIR